MGALEPKFFAQMVAGLGLSDRQYDQNDRSGWPAMQADFTAAFASRTRDEWARVFEATDACVTPVLSMEEAQHHPHNRARATFVDRNAVSQPAPAPRLSVTAGAIEAPQSLDISDAIKSWS